VPLTWAVLLLFDPTREGEAMTYADVQDEVTRWLVVHLGMMVFIPLMAGAVCLLVRGIESTTGRVCRIALRLAALVAVLTVGAAVPASAEGADVGHRVENLVVPGSALCPDPDVPCELENRKLKVHLWYPADQRRFSEARKTEYTSALYGEELIPNLWDPLSWKVEAEIARETDAIDPHGKPFPVIVFSHGSTNDPIDYAHTLELIAGEGFVVAAPYHVNNTQDDARIDFINTEASRLTPPVPPLFDCDDGRPSPCSRIVVARSMEDRVRDISHILDALPGWFGDRVDVSRAGVMGHSRGTVTALAAAGGSSTWGFGPETRVKAIMGMAIGAPAITFAANLADVTVPAVLIAGGKDRNPPNAQSVSETAFDTIKSPDKLFVAIPKATHRSFDSTYCGQLQSAGAAFDLDHDGVVELSELESDTDGDEVVDRSDLDSTRAILDLHTVRLIAASAPGGASGKAVHYCASEFFTSPVDIRELVGAHAVATLNIPSSEFSCSGEEVRVCAPMTSSECDIPTNKVPCTGLDTEEVKEGVKEIAVAFFDSALKRTGNDGIHFTRYLAPKWLMEHVPMVGAAEAHAGPGSVCPPDQGVICPD
jgi:predicted dienelactone hydrolase